MRTLRGAGCVRCLRFLSHPPRLQSSFLRWRWSSVGSQPRPGGEATFWRLVRALSFQRVSPWGHKANHADERGHVCNVP